MIWTALAMGALGFAGGLGGDEKMHMLAKEYRFPHYEFYDTTYWRGVSVRHDYARYVPSEPTLTIAEVSLVVATIGLVVWRKMR